MESGLDVDGIRRELRVLAEQCRAFALACEEASRRLASLVPPPPYQARAVQTSQRMPAPPRDTLPEPCKFDIVDPAAVESVAVAYERDDGSSPTLVRIAPGGRRGAEATGMR